MYKSLILTAIVVLGFTVYVAGLRAIPGNITSNSPAVNPPYDYSPAFELSGSRSSFATLLALNETGKFDLSIKLADLATPDTGFYNGKIYSFFPPGVALIGLPFYKLGTYFNLSLVFAYFSISIFALLALILLFKICIEVFNLPVWTSLFVVILTGFASHFFNFAIDFYSQVPSAFFILLSFYSVWRYKKQTRFSWVWGCMVWGSFGLASFFNYPNLILMLPLLVYFFISAVTVRTDPKSISISIKNTFAITALVVILLGGLHMYYNYKNFGRWSRFSNALATYDSTHASSTLAVLSQENVDVISDAKLKASAVFNEQQLVKGVYEILLALNKSMLMHDPFFLLSLVGLILLLRKGVTAEIGTLVAVVLLNIFIYASFGDPWGGWSFGPRYLVPSVPIFAIFFGYWLSMPGAVIAKKILALELFFYGAMVALIGVVGRTIIVPDAQAPASNPFRTYLGTIDLIKNNRNGNYIFNTFLSSKLSLLQFYFIFLGFLILIAFITLFIIPMFEKYAESSQANGKRIRRLY